MRRRKVYRGAAVGLLAAGMRHTTSRASGAALTLPATARAMAVVEAFQDAWDARDATALDALFAPGAEMRELLDAGSRPVIRTRNRGVISDWLTRLASFGAAAWGSATSTGPDRVRWWAALPDVSDGRDQIGDGSGAAGRTLLLEAELTAEDLIAVLCVGSTPEALHAAWQAPDEDSGSLPPQKGWAAPAAVSHLTVAGPEPVDYGVAAAGVAAIAGIVLLRRRAHPAR